MNKRRYFYWTAFIGILLIAGVVRMYHLGSIPSGICENEAYNAYNAYSLATYGDSLYFDSNLFRSTGTDIITGYLMAPLIKVLGLQAWVVRLPLAVLSCITLVLFYAVAKKVFGEKTALAAFFLLAVSPWHILSMRGNTSSGLVPILFLAATYFYLKAADNSKWMVLSMLFYSLCLYSGFILCLAVPVIVLVQTAYCIQFRRMNYKDIYVWLSLVFFAIVSIPGILGLIRQGGLSGSVLSNLSMVVKILYDQQDTQMLYGWYYRFSAAFLIIGLAVLLYTNLTSIKNRTYHVSVLIGIQTVLLFCFSAFINVVDDVNQFNLFFPYAILFAADGVLVVSAKYWKEFKWIAFFLYCVEFCSFLGYYRNDYDKSTAKTYLKGLEYCMEDAGLREGTVYVDETIPAAHIWYYRRLPVQELKDTAVLNETGALERYGRYVTLHTKKDAVANSPADYDALGDGIYIMNGAVGRELEEKN